MKPGFSRLLAAAWWLFRREHSLIVALAAPFVFLPSFALLLLSDPVPTLPDAPRDQAAMEAWLAQVQQWAGVNGGWYVLSDAIALFGLASLALLLVAPDRLTVAQAMRRAAGRYLSFALIGIAGAVGVGLGLWLFVLPGLWVQARLIAALPALATEGAGGRAALARSVRLTRGHGFALTGATVTLFLAQWLASVPIITADGWLRIGGHENPVLLVLVDAALAAVGAGWRIALLLVGIVVYRVLASKGT